MNENIIGSSRKAPEYMPSVYCNTPAMYARDLPGMVSVDMKKLFPNLPEAIYAGDEDDVAVFDRLTREALEKVDMSDITPETSVNIVCSEHGFCICGGKPYVQMLKAIRDAVIERTGCIDLRLRVVMWRTPKEGQEAVEFYNLKEEFDNNVEYVWSYDKAVPIETRIGTFYGLDKVYDADKFIYAYYDDPREIYCHKMYRKSFKAFTMDMARYETRSIFHKSMGDGLTNSNVSDIIPLSIFDSDFVQSKYTFSCFLTSAPTGITGIDAGNDLYALDNRVSANTLRYYAYPYHLFRSLEDFSAIVEGGRWVWYMHGGGVIDGILFNGYKDFMDIDDNVVAPGNGMMTQAPGLKAAIINQCWYGITFTASAVMPIYVVGKELQDNLQYNDVMAKYFFLFPGSKRADTLEEAVAGCREASGTNKFLVFDGSFGFINCTQEMAEELIAKAPAIQDKVDNELYPKYMKQRGFEIK